MTDATRLPAPAGGGEARRRLGLLMLALAVASALLVLPGVAGFLVAAAGLGAKAAYPLDRLLGWGLSHALITAVAVGPAAFIGIAAGIAVTRPASREWRPLADRLVAAAQAVPPVVVVALAFPVLGFGPAPTVLALVIYCVMPLLRGTVAAIETASPDARDAARAMGLTSAQVLREVELPLALPVIAEALRVALVLAVATAAVGALAGASTLGTPIIVGLQNQNEAYILQGAAATAALAFLADGLLLLLLRARP
ncbi:MAG TPA: ABC transporter permease subunit [Microvirga sp.]|nr:ABC transporter permease subunit [Microvirga sp.]